MSRKDFELIARVLRESQDILEPPILELLAERFACALATTNPRFSHGRFLAAAARLSPGQKRVA